jgi:hypothetical protein
LDENRADGPYTIDKQLTTLPATIGIKAGILSFATNVVTPMAEGARLKVFIQSPKNASLLVGALSVSPMPRHDHCPSFVLSVESPQRSVRLSQAAGYLVHPAGQRRQKLNCLRNRGVYEWRLETINCELGATAKALENYKKRNNMWS